MLIDNVEITASGFHPCRDELKNYVDFVRKRVPEVAHINVVLAENGDVDLHYTAYFQKFERIRRITGYLVGTTDRWNDAKQAEERERVKHM